MSPCRFPNVFKQIQPVLNLLPMLPTMLHYHPPSRLDKQHAEDELRINSLVVEAARHKRDRQRLEGRLEAAQVGRSDLTGIVEQMKQHMEHMEAVEGQGRDLTRRVRRAWGPLSHLPTLMTPCFIIHIWKMAG